MIRRRADHEHLVDPPEWHDPGLDADYGVGAQILIDLGVKEMVLLTNSQKSVVGLEGFGLKIVGQRPVPGRPSPRRPRPK